MRPEIPLIQESTHDSGCFVDEPVHFCYAPLDDIAEMLVVDIVVLLANGSLRTILEFVLTVAK